MRCRAVLCFLFVCVLAQFAESLKASEKGVCVSKHTVIKTRPKTVLVALSKWCGKKKCTAKQTRQQKYSVVTNRLMCCKGFVYTAQNDSCAPVCSTGCLNGTCIDPDVCQCTPPTYLDPVTKNKCLTPVCDHPCINSYCTVNNTCTCLKNFTILNSTHCVPNCTTGYELDSSLSCVPKCENCLNGHCTAPDTCTCDPGYALDGSCKPVCSSKCVNGICVAPDTCKCIDGFKTNGTECIPNCDYCDNGRCTAPDVCECDKGYAMVNGSCQPACKDNCVNGYCVAPDTCACEEGFQKKNTTVCYLPCGECRPDGTCSIERKPRMGTTTYRCNGGRRCTRSMKRMPQKPTIMCCIDYEFDKSGVCKPLCLDGCIGGNCTAPDVCTCQPPLVLAINRCVAPTCNNPCVHGECTALNTCTCDPGYYLKEDNFTCVPRCTNCTNGICEVPNVCKCNPGYYKKTEGGDCVPECNNCSNGHCNTPNACKCNVNYEMREGNCKPVCKTPCVNGNCVSPDTCECLEGYKRGASKEVCEPKCDNCGHGDCISPNECRCHKGYAMLDGVCAPICRDTCVNGNCSAPNECSCNKGYIQNVTNPFVCYKPCVECNHGACNLEGECICEEEFELINGTCTVLIPVMAGIATTPGLAGLEVSWLVGGAVGLLLVILLIVAIDRSWRRRRKDLGPKNVETDKTYSSVAFTTTNTLIRKNETPTDIPESNEEGTSEALVAQENSIV